MGARQRVFCYLALTLSFSMSHPLRRQQLARGVAGRLLAATGCDGRFYVPLRAASREQQAEQQLIFQTRWDLGVARWYLPREPVFLCFAQLAPIFERCTLAGRSTLSAPIILLREGTTSTGVPLLPRLACHCVAKTF